MTTPPTIAQAFDAFAEAYDQSLDPILPVKDALHLLIRSHFATLPASARILVAGAGTGAEVRFLAPLFPGWRFTLVDPSAGMLAVCRRHAIAEGFADRCELHVGHVASLPLEPFDAAASVLASHFLADPIERQAYFVEIAARLKPGGRFFNADLCASLDDPSFEPLMTLWLELARVPEERRAGFRTAFGKSLAVQGPAEVETMITRAGFSVPVPCVQAALIRGWAASRL